MLPLAETERRQSRLSAMRAIQVALGRPRSIAHLSRVLQRELAETLNASTFLIGLYDEVSGMVEVVHQTDEGRELGTGSFPLGRGFTSQAIRTRQPSLIRHWSVDGPRVQLQYATERPCLPESAITVPLLVGDLPVGVMSLQSYAVDAFDEDDLLLVQAVAAQVAPALDLLQRGSAVQATRRASELEAILASMTEALLVVDREGRITSLNPPARAIFGSIGHGVVLGQPLDRAQAGTWPLGARAVAEVLEPVVAALARGEALRDLELEVNSDGRRVLSFSSSPVCDASGHPAGGVIVFRDVTTQRDVARLKDELLSIASHDLRTPVTVLKCEAQLIQRTIRHGDLDPSKLDARVELIVDQADRLTGMLNLLLDLSRVEAGRLDLSREPMELVQLVERAVQSVQALTTKHTIVLRTHRRLPIQGLWDPRRLDQVLQNLLTNAVKYSPHGGDIEVRIESNGRAAHVSVRDSGMGIAAEDLPHVFERYYRVASSRKLEGTGLGLYICQGIIAAHGGRLWAESEGHGHGTIFSFSLPH